MAKIRLDNVDHATQGRIAEQVTLEDRKQRVHLYTHSKVEGSRKTFAGIGKQDYSGLGSNKDDDDTRIVRRPKPEEIPRVKMSDGTVLEMPLLTDDEYNGIDQILSSTTPEQADYLVKTGQQFAAKTMEEVANDNADGPYGLETTQSALRTYEAVVATDTHASQEDATTGALLLGLHGAETNLREHFTKIRGEQQLQNELRTDVADLDAALADWPDDGSTEVFDYREVIINEDGSVSVVEHRNVEMTKAQAQALRQRLNGSVEALGQFHMQQMYELQYNVQKYQQAQNTLSNVLKNMHETHKAIISNARA